MHPPICEKCAYHRFNGVQKSMLASKAGQVMDCTEERLPVRSLQRLVGWNSILLTSGSIETRPPKNVAGSDIDAAFPQLRREFQRLRADFRSRTGQPLTNVRNRCWPRAACSEAKETSDTDGSQRQRASQLVLRGRKTEAHRLLLRGRPHSGFILQVSFVSLAFFLLPI